MDIHQRLLQEAEETPRVAALCVEAAKEIDRLRAVIENVGLSIGLEGIPPILEK